MFLQLSDTDAVLPRKVLGMGEVRFREVQKTSGVSSRLGLRVSAVRNPEPLGGADCYYSVRWWSSGEHYPRQGLRSCTGL